MSDDIHDDFDPAEYESGSFCQHWHDAWECDEICKNCEHACSQHYVGDECLEDDCSCEKFEDLDD